MTDITDVALAATCNAKVAFKVAVGAIKICTGDTTSPNFRQEMDRFKKQVYATLQAYAADLPSIARKTSMKDNVNLGTVQQMVSAILTAASLPDSTAAPTTAAPTHDEDVVTYAIKLVFIPIWERTGHLNSTGATITTNEQMALDHLKDFAYITAGVLSTTELLRQTLHQASDPIDLKVGSLPTDIANGLRIACVLGAKEMTFLEPELAAAIKNKRALPSRFNAHPLAAKYAMLLLLRVIAPVITHRLKGQNLFVNVASVVDVCLANDPTAPIVITVQEFRERPHHDGPPKKKT
jgi:hypothetical protein